MNDHIPEGGFIVARKIYRSKIWLKHPFHLKVWLWILGQANHSNHEKNGRIYKRGELVTTYDEIIKNTAYYFNRRHILLTLKQIRIILDWLEGEKMILVQPLQQNGQSERLTRADPRADPRARTRAYLGIRIIVINYDTYQDAKSYKGRPQNGNQGTPSVQLGHDNNNDNNVKRKIYVHFGQFWTAYPKKQQKKNALKAWKKLNPDAELVETISKALEVHKQTNKWQNPQFISLAASWLNGRMWEDEIDPGEMQSKEEQDPWAHIPK